MEWLKEILKDIEGAEDLEKKIAGGIGKNFVSRLDFNALNTTKKELEAKITEFETSGKDAEKFKTELETLKTQIAEEKAAAEQAAKEAKEQEEMQSRFNSVVGEQKFRDELTGKAIYNEFVSSLKDEANKGKGDKDILEMLTKDKNYFDNPNKPVDMPGMGSVGMTDVEENSMRAIMGLPAKENK
ncbi:hypothetical protein CLNEO_26990 [Anaerotignum neopropionicum]|uniref:Phage minor structural protein GP20 n=1 Tax=Anaerotignum neopropionicum TaxID=36847 RepID=A0A136WBY8_9FIRM|nr:hypothetical protein [Anaerotignum neopropionicum]KXL52000.1 hypothetical protein CLNEO_26990 [Anaerotignum neopropionicum]